MDLVRNVLIEPMSNQSETTDTSGEFSVRQADLTDAEDAAVIQQLLNEYAQHPMGQSAPLGLEIQDALIEEMRSHPTSLAFLAEKRDEVVGIATCFIGFSTFKANKLINIHDLFVSQSVRGQGVGGKIIDAVADYARSEGLCAVTLEVLETNPARFLYAKKGFQGIGNLQAEDQVTEDQVTMAVQGREPATYFGKLPISFS